MQAMYEPRTPLGFLFGLLALFLNRMNDGRFLDISHEHANLFNLPLTKNGPPVSFNSVLEALERQNYEERYKQSMHAAICKAKRAFEALDSQEIGALWEASTEIRKLMATCVENHGIIDSKLNLLQGRDAAQNMYRTTSNVCVGYCNGQSYPFPSLSLLNPMLKALKRENKTFAACSLVFFDSDSELDTFEDKKSHDALYHFVRLSEMLKNGQDIYDLTYGDFRKKALEKFAICTSCSETRFCGENACSYIDEQRIGGEALKLLRIIRSKATIEVD